MKKLTASIVCYKTSKEMLERAISSFLNTNLDVKLYIIDNSPNDKIRSWFEDERIEYVFNNANVGFGAANNVAINKILNSSKYHLVLNPDVYFSSTILVKLYEYMERNSDVGLIMPKVLYNHGSTQYLCKLLPTPFGLLIRRFVPIKSIHNKLNNYYELRVADYNTTFEAPVLSGCFMFVRTSVLKELGGFDERFFMYMEDADLCRRIHSKYKNVYFPEVEIYHGYEKGSYNNIKLLFSHLVSAIKYFNKWGWFFDRERNKTNKLTIQKIKEHL